MNPNIYLSYTALRKIVGILGLALPVILIGWGYALHGHMLPSMSAYYQWETRDAFVGVLFAVGFFLACYQGYDKKDHTAAFIAGLAAMGVAVFPYNGHPRNGLLHLICAVIFFLTLAYTAFFLFTKTEGTPTPQKLQRNTIYRTCGILMVGGMGAMVGKEVWWPNTTQPIVFVSEVVMLWSFGVSWLVKGETFFKDV